MASRTEVRARGLHAVVEHAGFTDEVAVEEPLELRVDGRPLTVTMRTPGFARTGGLHATGLFAPDGTLLLAREDVGRHNAMDKVVGRMLLDGGLPLHPRLLCVSGRRRLHLGAAVDAQRQAGQRHRAGRRQPPLRRNRAFREGQVRGRDRPDRDPQAHRLKPSKTYYYRFTMGEDRSEVGRFETAPAPRTDATVRFAYSGDADPVKIPGMGKLFFAPFAVYARMASEGNDFNVNLGDTMYSDTDSQYERQDPIALTSSS